MSPKLTAWLTALGVCALSALVAWLGGYDFDERNGGVALWAAATVVMAVALGGLAGSSRELEIAQEQRFTNPKE